MIEPTRIFVKVIQLGSFSKAAQVLKLPKSTVSRTISKLEKDTGTTLLLRTTRSLTLTAAGQSLYDTCREPVQILEEALRSLEGQDQLISGRVRLTAPEDLGAHVISPTMGRISKNNPGLFFELVYTDKIVDLVKEGFDIAIRIGKLTPSRFRVTKLGEIFLVLVASPDYLKRHPKIKEPQDLKNQSCLNYEDHSSNPKWNLKFQESSSSVAIKPSLSSNQMTSLMAMASQGAGIAFIPMYLCQNELQQGRLVQVLPGWSSPGLPVSMLTPLSASSSARLKLVSSQLSLAIKEALQVL